VEEVTNSVNNSCHRELTFQETLHIVQSYGQLMQRDEVGTDFVKASIALTADYFLVHVSE